MKDHFPRMKLLPNTSCSDTNCIKRQEEYKEKVANQVVDESLKVSEKESAVVHEDNIYGEFWQIS